MLFRQRLTLSLLISIGLSMLFLVLLRMTHSHIFFLLQLPGFYASAPVLQIQSNSLNAAIGALLFGWVNALVYWPLVLACTFLFSRHSQQ